MQVACRRSIRGLLAGAVSVAVLLSMLSVGYAATSKQVVLTFWHQETPPQRVQRIQALLDRFEKETGIKVKQTVIDWGDVYTKTSTALSAGTEPDMGMCLPGNAVEMRRLGAIVPLDDVVAEVDRSYSFHKKLLVPYQYENHYWALPVLAINHVMWYNDRLFKKAGISRAPETWDELLDAAKRLTKDGVYGIGLPTSKHQYTDQVLWSFMATNGADVFDEKGNVVFDSPKTVETLRFFKELCKYSPPDSSGWSWAEGTTAFATQKVAMLNLGGSLIETIDKGTDFAKDLRAFLVPVPKGGKRGTIGYAFGIYVFKSTEKRGHLDAVKTFLKWLMKPENNAELLLAQPAFFLPVTEATAKSNVFWGNDIVSKYKTAVETQISSVATASSYGFEHGPHPLAGALEGSNLLSEVVQKVVTGQMSPEAAAKWGADRIKELGR